mgnify:CR=1 FL=1
MRSDFLHRVAGTETGGALPINKVCSAEIAAISALAKAIASFSEDGLAAAPSVTTFAAFGSTSPDRFSESSIQRLDTAAIAETDVNRMSLLLANSVPRFRIKLSWSGYCVHGHRFKAF